MGPCSMPISLSMRFSSDSSSDVPSMASFTPLRNMGSTRSAMRPSSMRTRSRASAGVSSRVSSRYLGTTLPAFSSSVTGTIQVTIFANQGVKPMNSRVLPTLNRVWALAICRGVSAARRLYLQICMLWRDTADQCRKFGYEPEPDENSQGIEGDMHHGSAQGFP